MLQPSLLLLLSLHASADLFRCSASDLTLVSPSFLVDPHPRIGLLPRIFTSVVRAGSVCSDTIDLASTPRYVRVGGGRRMEEGRKAGEERDWEVVES